MDTLCKRFRNYLYFFLYSLLRVWKIMCIFAPDFEIISYDRKTQLVLWTAF